MNRTIFLLLITGSVFQSINAQESLSDTTNLIITDSSTQMPDSTNMPVADDSEIATSESPDGASDYLGSDYNLGRIIGRLPILNTLASTWLADEFVLLDLFNIQGGMDDKYNLKWNSILGVFAASDAAWLMMFPGADYSCAVGPSNRLRGATYISNAVFLASSQYSSSGLEQPLYMIKMHQWDFLSNKGRIHVAPEQYENAFYLKPLLNAGQIRAKTFVAHTIRGEKSEMPSLLSVQSQISAGIIENMQVSISGKYGKSVLNIQQYFGDGGYDGYNFEEDTVTSDFALTCRLPQVSFTGGYTFKRLWYGDFTSNYHTVSADGSFILGKSVNSFQELNGNWDNYFTPLLGRNQLLLQSGIDFYFDDKKRYTITSEDRGDLFFYEKAQYGICSFATLGETFSKGTSPKLELSAILMNIPRRTYGPSEASKFEYQFGLWPHRGQVRFDLKYVPPIGKEYINYSGPIPIYQRIQADSSQLTNSNGVIVPDMYVSTPYFDLANRTVLNRGIINNKDLIFNVALGITNSLILAGNFEMRIDKYGNELTYEYNPNRWGNYYHYDSQPVYISENIIYAASYIIAAGDPKKYLILLHFTQFGQSDRNAEKEDKNSFLLGFTVEGVF